MLCWPLDSKDSTRWHHDMTWHHEIPPDWFLRKKNRGWWLVTCIFSWYDPYHPWSSGLFPRPHCWNSVLIEAARAVRKKRFLFIFTLRCHAAIALEFPHVFFWAGPQSQWSYAKSFVWWVWTFKLAKMQISWTPKQHWTQFSVRLLATQSVSKFSCQVLIPNKLYIACIYIHNHIYTILHTHRACYVSSQVAKNPSAWWVICGVLQAQDAMFSTEDSRAAADVTTWARPKPGRGDVYFLPEVCFFSRWIYWDEPNKRIWVCYFCWDLCGEVWWNATDYLGPKRFGNRSNFVPTILGSSRSFLCEQQRERNIFRKRSSTAMCKPIMESSWTFIPFAQSNNPTTESP